MSVGICDSRAVPGCRISWPVCDYDLHKTLDCGQAFRWRRDGESWVGVVAGRWVRLATHAGELHAETAVAQTDWRWLRHYLQIDLDLSRVLRTFPDDEPMRAAAAACRGLRLLRQDPWECLASFLLSATKQIVQIRQVITALSERFGDQVRTPAGISPAFGFPSASRIAAICEADLRLCKMGFRAPHLLGAARNVTEGRLNLKQLPSLPIAQARERLMQLNGVGPKIADCVLLCGCGFQEAFPIDVWMQRVLRESYFGRRPVALRELREFAARHFGPHAGYAQQYFFHYVRMRQRQKLSG